MKRCPRCRQRKPAAEFYRNGASLQSWCRTCKAADMRRRRAEHQTQDRRHDVRIMPHGEAHPRAKLRADEVRLLKRLKGEMPARIVAEKFDVSRSLVRAIWRGEYWSHVFP